jgi:hypothetical protein
MMLLLDRFISSCNLRGSEFGALNVHLNETDFHAIDLAPLASPRQSRATDLPIFASREDSSPRQGFLPWAFCYSELAMREDMYKVIVERPRCWKATDKVAARLRRDFDGPMRLGARMGYGRPSLNENLTPLRRYLHAQIGWLRGVAESQGYRTPNTCAPVTANLGVIAQMKSDWTAKMVSC